MRYRTFAVGAYSTKVNDKRVLKIALNKKDGHGLADSGTIQKSSSTLLFSLMRNLGSIAPSSFVAYCIEQFGKSDRLKRRCMISTSSGLSSTKRRCRLDLSDAVLPITQPISFATLY